ncbi:hypothetical protein HanRHA438_Chr09g0418271 [Helianthus annuus]|nr:hypothetical protein HanHA300_Chr09g0333601 [Helianthus annuus]KAJ0543804.1 hypothetical protein HanHA89_Chr09g0354581 [Helianthus annuus]KAJ0708857.1 hypothetical protein HanLR1_Chr09g0333881 [Helianthus annuus]KAJ0889939.1 hypothetical protein HanRHA438_Chr09g0418271 [Helianthus annuus]
MGIFVNSPPTHIKLSLIYIKNIFNYCFLFVQEEPTGDYCLGDTHVTHLLLSHKINPLIFFSLLYLLPPPPPTTIISPTNRHRHNPSHATTHSSPQPHAQ